MLDPPAGIPGLVPIQGIDPLVPIAAIPGFVSTATGDVGAPFRLDALPATVQQAFKKGPASWPDAVQEAIRVGIRDLRKLADLMFFMQHSERMTGVVGKLIEKGEPDFYKLRVEWTLYLTIVTRILEPSTKPTVFLPARSSRNYEDFVAAPTTGRIRLMVHGRNSDGSGHTDSKGIWDGFKDAVDTYNRMQETVESLGAGDTLYIANWAFLLVVGLPGAEPPLTIERASGGIRTWPELLTSKAKEGVRIRVIVAQHPPFSPFMTDLERLDTLITGIPLAQRDNFKYIASGHPHVLGVHHQKFVVARKGKSTVAFCGGLDIAPNRAPGNWGRDWVWHDVAAKLEGRITYDLERQFVALWNRDKDESRAKPLAGWKTPFETLSQGAVSGPDQAPAVNKQRLQMLRTVTLGPEPSKIRRDDIWEGYFRLIGRARRFIYLEDQYFHEPKLADGIVKQAEAEPALIVIVMVGTGTDDLQRVDPKATGLERAKQQAQVDATQNAFALRLEFFKRLSVRPLVPNRLRVYTLNYSFGILHSKLILVDDEALSVGSANANPRGFFFDTEVNVMLDDAETVKTFRQRLWAHNLGKTPGTVAAWSVSEFLARWDEVAKSNQGLQRDPEKMVGEGVIPFEPLNPKDLRFRAGKRGPIHLPFGQTIDPVEALF